jgi:hypothetical protein
MYKILRTLRKWQLAHSSVTWAMHVFLWSYIVVVFFILVSATYVLANHLFILITCIDTFSAIPADTYAKTIVIHIMKWYLAMIYLPYIYLLYIYIYI